MHSGSLPGKVRCKIRCVYGASLESKVRATKLEHGSRKMYANFPSELVGEWVMTMLFVCVFFSLVSAVQGLIRRDSSTTNFLTPIQAGSRSSQNASFFPHQAQQYKGIVGRSRGPYSTLPGARLADEDALLHLVAQGPIQGIRAQRNDNQVEDLSGLCQM